jgi:hypothetical protein
MYAMNWKSVRYAAACLALAVGLAGVGCDRAFAQNVQGQPLTPEERDEVWRRMTPEQRQQFWLNLTPPQRADAWRRLSPEQRQAIRERLTPEQREAMRRRWMEPREREGAMRGSRRLTPEERQQLRDQIRESNRELERGERRMGPRHGTQNRR